MSSKVFQLESVKNKIKKNGFDLSQSRMFSTPPGKINVVYCKEFLPGDKVRINVENLTRTQTLNTAAFARAKEYWNFHFVPYRLLWRFFPDFIVQNSHSDSAQSVRDSSVPTQVPRFAIDELCAEMMHVRDKYYTPNDNEDELGFGFNQGITKLCQQLGYGYMDPAQQYPSNSYVSLFRLLAYQKVYQDFYRNSQWESYDSTAFNVDYLNSTTSSSSTNKLTINFDPTDSDNNRSIFTMRYANYKMDYFMGLRPSTQFGDVSVVSVETSDVETLSSYNGQAFRVIDGKVAVGQSSSSTVPATLKGTFDILSLRKAEAIQRLREIQQANDFRYNAQINARFGFKIPDSRAQMAEYIGGHSNTLTITDVEATSTSTISDSPSINTSSRLGQIGGKGTMQSEPNVINYNVEENGIIIGTYYIAPIVNYPAVGVDKENMHLEFEDFYQPEFQNIGLSGVKLSELSLLTNPQSGFANADLGFAPRYLEYKTEKDLVFDEFVSGNSLAYWNVSVPQDKLELVEVAGYIDYRFMKIPPSAMDAIFAVDYNGNENTNNFLINSYLTVRAIRPMSVDGMPY